MRKLGDHPQVVPVLDTGEDDGNPFIVSRYMPGGDVQGLLAAAGGRLEVQRAVEIAADVTRALEHAHARGIVHRDLKPANVWIDDDGHAQTRRLRPGHNRGARPRQRRDPGRHGRLPATGAGAGRGRRPEERPLLARRPPLRDAHRRAAFPGRRRGLDHLPAPARRSGAALAPQRRRSRRRSTARCSHCSPSAPRTGRPTPPTRVELMLAALEEQPAEAGRGAARQPARGPRRRRLRRPRAGARAASRGRGLSARRPRLPPAAGRRARYRQDARLRGARHLRPRQRRAASTGGAAARTRAHRPTGRGCRRSAPTCAMPTPSRSAGSSARARRGRPAGSRGGREARRRAGQRQRQEEARFRLFDSVTSLLLAAARDRPIVIVLDDLHWADEPSLLLLRFAAKELASSGLLVLGTYRDVELGRHHPLARMLGEMSGIEGSGRIPLRGLSVAAVERYIEMTAGRAGAAGPGGRRPGADRRQPVLRRRGRPPAGQRGQAHRAVAALPSCRSRRAFARWSAAASIASARRPTRRCGSRR